MSHGAWRVADVRAAEDALMAKLPEGTLMQRAATGLATRCAHLLDGNLYGARILLLVGAGNNGGDALYAGARLAKRGARVQALLLDKERAHQKGLTALRSAGGSTVDRVPSTVDIVLDGIVGIGGRGGLRPEAAARVAEAGRGSRGGVALRLPPRGGARTWAGGGGAGDRESHRLET